MPDLLDALVPADSPAARSTRYLDVGLGGLPHTTVEWARALRVLDPSATVLGIDRDPDVVAAAAPHSEPGVRFGVAEWTWPGLEARAIRVLNVLRDYPRAEAPVAHARCAAGLATGGVLVEGSCGPGGEVGVVHLLRREGSRLADAGLLCWTDGSEGAAPILFRDRLPSAVRRGVRPGHPLGELMTSWMRAFSEVREPGASALSLLHASVGRLGDPALVSVREGVVWWRAPCGVVHPEISGGA